MMINLDEELLDWDFYAVPDPERPSGIIEVKLEYIGELKPEIYLENDED